MSISFTMKIRGVPFEAGEKEVFEVIEMRQQENRIVILMFSSSLVLLYLFDSNKKILLVVNHPYGMQNLVHEKKQRKH